MPAQQFPGPAANLAKTWAAACGHRSPRPLGPGTRVRNKADLLRIDQLEAEMNADMKRHTFCATGYFASNRLGQSPNFARSVIRIRMAPAFTQ